MIFCGACSGVVLGNVTVKIPFSIDALISSGYEHSVSSPYLHLNLQQPRLP